MFSIYSLVNAGIIFFGYIFQNLALQTYFYYMRSKDAESWKTQPKKGYMGEIFGIPMFGTLKGGRAPDHLVLTTINLLVATAFAFTVTELCIRGYSKMSFKHPTSSADYLDIIYQLCMAVVYENIAEYYWHRLLHTKYLYARFHKIHHHYKSPEPWDDMYIHPLEAFLYYCILYAPPFLFFMPVYSFILYMIIMGLCGTIDHSGVKIAIPGFYDASDHDRHHSLFEVNYAFPNPWLDILHGTYRGTFLGWEISPRNVRHRQDVAREE